MTTAKNHHKIIGIERSCNTRQTQCCNGLKLAEEVAYADKIRTDRKRRRAEELDEKVFAAHSLEWKISKHNFI